MITKSLLPFQDYKHCIFFKGGECLIKNYGKPKMCKVLKARLDVENYKTETKYRKCRNFEFTGRKLNKSIYY